MLVSTMMVIKYAYVVGSLYSYVCSPLLRYAAAFLYEADLKALHDNPNCNRKRFQ